ncbi:MAG: DNA primase [Rikenellaceae bacterium]|jgi:DNA primase|nr:DNA primase [Rikenellaceae bacterium]
MIDRTTVDRIYAAANIVEVVNDFVTLRKKGVNYQACCPFHNEKTPSFVVSPSKGVFKCFGCGKGGNAVTFVMEHENMAYHEALKYVAHKYGIEVREREMTPEDKKQNDDRESMMVVGSFAADFFRDTLHNTSEGQNVGLGYFRERGIADTMIERFGLGFCPAAGDALSKAALTAGYREEFLVRTGLSIKRDTGTLYDRFAGRVIFPIHGVSGRVIAFGGRTLRTDKKVAKYVNSPESEIYHKSNILYGLYQAKRAISQHDCCILVEGYTDVISMHQSGIEHVVASSGTSLTTEQVKLIGRFTKNVTVIYDGDPAGIKASLRGIDMILKEGLNVRVVLLPDGADPDSFANTRSASQLQDYITENEQDFISFKAKLLLADAQNDPLKRAALITDVVESIAVIPEAIPRSVYIRECARLLSVDEGLLQQEVRRKRRDTRFSDEEREFIRKREILDHASSVPALPVGPPIEGYGSSVEGLEREIVTYLLRYGRQKVDFSEPDERPAEGEEPHPPTVAQAIIEDLQADGLILTRSVYGPIYTEYLAAYAENPGCDTDDQFPMNRFTDHPDPAVCNAVVDMMMRGETLRASKLWERNDIVVYSEADNLAIAVPRAVTLYKTKIIERMIEELRARLIGIEFGPAVAEIMRKIDLLNETRRKISTRYSRIQL